MWIYCARNPEKKTGRTRRQSQRLRLSCLVLAHESRQPPARLIFNVGLKMKKRVVILIASEAFLLGIAALVFSGIVRRAQTEVTSDDSSGWRGYPDGKRPKVLLGYDGPYERIADAIRIDVRRGVPHTRVDEAPIE